MDDGLIVAARSAKSHLRSVVRGRLDVMTRSERTGADQMICRHLFSLAGEIGARFVMGYVALADEVRIDTFLAEMLEAGRETLLPCAAGGRLRHAAWRPGARLSRDEKGVLAPEAGSSDLLPDGTGLIVVPGRAFDNVGGRLGRGGGYYDRLLSAMGGDRLVVGAAYERQFVEEVPREQHDRVVAGVVTETGCRRFRSATAG